MIINIADLKDPNDKLGRSYREANKEKKHKYKIGDLVELKTGVRLFIVKLCRDCDQTPLYSLCPDKDDVVQERKGFGNHGWHNGYGEESLKLVV